jgi:hypothetical protein
MANKKETSHWAFGNMIGGLSCLPSVLTTLVSSTTSGSTPTILQKISRNTTNVDWDGKCYLGVSMSWDNDGCRVHVSMLDYVPKALTHFQHRAPSKSQHQPYPHIKSNYGAKAQYMEDTDTLA